MSRFITPPDVDFADDTSVLLKNYSAADIEVVALTAKCTARDFDIYLYKDDYDDTAWLARVESMVHKTFTSGTDTLSNIVDYLQPK